MIYVPNSIFSTSLSRPSSSPPPPPPPPSSSSSPPSSSPPSSSSSSLIQLMINSRVRDPSPFARWIGDYISKAMMFARDSRQDSIDASFNLQL